jgi:uncharacterized protein
MNCPNCKTTLLITDRRGIEIDFCPQCRGVWLDRGELDKIIERSATDTRWHQYADKDDRDRSFQAPAGYKKRKKSFLGELFDLD